MNKFKGFLVVLVPVLILATIIQFATGQFRTPPPEPNEAKSKEEAPQEPIGNKGDETSPASPSPSETAPSEESEAITDEDREKTKEIAKQFAETYYNYNAADQLSYLEASKPYMTTQFYEMEKNNPRRNPLNKVKTEAQEIEMYKVDHASNYEIIWEAYITAKITSSDGIKATEETSLMISLEEADNQWKVKGASFNEW